MRPNGLVLLGRVAISLAATHPRYAWEAVLSDMTRQSAFRYFHASTISTLGWTKVLLILKWQNKGKLATRLFPSSGRPREGRVPSAQSLTAAPRRQRARPLPGSGALPTP